MKGKRLHPLGSVLIILGLLVPLVAFFISLWQGHPDPSSFRLSELGGLTVVMAEGSHVFKCPETGEVLPLSRIPVEPENEGQYEKFFEEHVYIVGRAEAGLTSFIVAGIILAGAGAALLLKNQGA